MTYWRKLKHVFKSGAEGIRTPELRRAKADRYILVRPVVSGDSAILQVISEVLDSVRPPRTSWYRPGCSTSAVVNLR